ncbi:MAG: 2-isopropylmalate synthase [Treponemataceae bacterium]|nr:2-isopropylmalate synthase [Treponemataceae bacterium]
MEVSMNPNGKYRAFEPIPIKNRKWPEKTIEKSPIWCSVDLRDGNQALINPMTVEEKLEFFDMLIKIGFKEIEVGFPASSDTEFTFMRRLIEENHVPDDVTLQVLCQARENLILRTFESLKGCKNAIFHLYNSTSPAQRKYTFNKSKEEIKQIAIEGIRCIKNCLDKAGDTHIRLEYSPESFSTTEIDYALEVCEAVKAEWNAKDGEKIIFNLPTTVECALPNQFADSIEYFCQNISDRESIIVSLHNHNDRGEGVAQCELGLLAGADRVEGCLFGNGERTGNLDIVTVALNMFTQGIDPHLDLRDIQHIGKEYTRFTGMEIHPRSPYAGELVFTAFSGSHQDAIRKGMAARVGKSENEYWDVPYLTIDPHDIGRQYEGIIRINSQSGKGGAAFIMENYHDIRMPKAMHTVFGALVKKATDQAQRELNIFEIRDIFESAWLKTKSPPNIMRILDMTFKDNYNSNTSDQYEVNATIEWNGIQYEIAQKGNGYINAFVRAMQKTPAPIFNITYYEGHSFGKGSDAPFIAYVQITKENGEQVWGVGKSSNSARAGINAVVSALNFAGINAVVSALNFKEEIEQNFYAPTRTITTNAVMRKKATNNQNRHKNSAQRQEEERLKSSSYNFDKDAQQKKRHNKNKRKNSAQRQGEERLKRSLLYS